MIKKRDHIAGTDDSDIVQKCIHGDTEVYSIIIERYQSVLYNLIYRIIGDRDDSLEVLQTVFTRAFEQLKAYDPQIEFIAWICQIAVNETVEYVHHQDRMTNMIEKSSIVVDHIPREFIPDTDAGKIIEEALLRLETDRRIIIILKHLGNFSYREISEILGITEKTAQSRLFTARHELIRQLSQKHTR
jgi:RNA polymerase sigma-70 factor, ECF subfamily